MARRFIVTLLGFTALALIPASDAQKNAPGSDPRERQRHSLAINLAQAINTAEAAYKKSHGSYASWETFIAAGDFSENGTKWAPESLPAVAHGMYGRGPEILPGWKLRLNLSKNAAAYDLILEDVNDPKCRYAVFSDERGLVREGRTIDCSQ